MIPASHKPWFVRAFLLYSTFLCKRHFYRVHVSGIRHLANLDRSIPMIAYCNHSSWWDGMFAFILSHKLFHVRPFAMMEEQQLLRYPFFRWIGAFSVVRENAREAVKAMHYAATVFDKPNTILWIYPQGRMVANDTRPLGFYRGTARITSLVGQTQIIPIVLRYEFLMEQRPEAFISIGAPILANRETQPAALTLALEEHLTTMLDDLRKTIVRGDLNRFSLLIQGKRSINATMDLILGKSHG